MPIIIFPCCNSSKPATIRSSGVLPQPEGPKRQTTSPSSTCKDAESRAVIPPNLLLTFFNSINYKSLAGNTKAAACITTKNLENYLPKNCIKIITKNVLYSVAEISKKFYPDSDLDYLDKSLVESKKVSWIQNLKKIK